MDYVTRGVCGQESCRERRYYLDNGQWFCRRGHLQEGTQVEEDADDFGKLGRISRVKREKEEKSRKTARGRKAQTLLLQAYQIILWKQCYALIHDHGFPEQFEGVVRDLWALKLQDYTSNIIESTDDEDVDSEPELFSSQPSQNDEDEPSVTIRPTYHTWPRISETVALCYLAAIIMQLPICLSDFYRLILRQDIPYIRPLKVVPREIKRQLPPEFTRILTVNRIPRVEVLHRTLRDIALRYQRKFGIELPPMNSPIIFYRHIKRLALPVDVYEIIQTLQKLLGFTFEYPEYLNDDKRIESLQLPEIQMMVLIVIATKLLFPFDNIPRNPATDLEPTAQGIDWQEWMRAQQQFESQKHREGKIGLEKAIQVSEADISRMEPHQLDEYLDWYEKEWLDTTKDPHELAEMFAPSETEKQTPSRHESGAGQSAYTDEDKELDALLRKVTEGIVSVPIVPDQEGEIVARPGMWYRRYRRVSALPAEARPFHEIAAKLAGVSLHKLVRAVSAAEWRLGHGLEYQARSEYPEYGSESNSEDGSDLEEGSDLEAGSDLEERSHSEEGSVIEGSDDEGDEDHDVDEGLHGNSGDEMDELNELDEQLMGLGVGDE
ncbi:hypothetical protein N7451_003393 [Penicillium sp. IBT 35674x]|nr:hypothetical protein N7451_003393 [Penicillium sp. IBT 35674x]